MIARDKHMPGLSLPTCTGHTVLVTATDRHKCVSQLKSPPRALEGRGGQCHLVPVQSDGRQGQRGHVEGAVLHKAADVAHGLPKNPRAVHKPDLRGSNNSSATKCGENKSMGVCFVFQQVPWLEPELAQRLWLVGQLHLKFIGRSANLVSEIPLQKSL